MKELKRFDVLSVGKVFGLFGFVISIVQMVLLKLISTNTTFAMQYGINASDFTFQTIVLGIVSATVIYFVSGIVIAFIYNFVAKYVGGVMFEMNDAKVAVKSKAKKK